MEEFKITIKSNLRYIWYPIGALLFLMGLGYYFGHFEFTGLAVAVFVLPALLVHGYYLHDNWRTQVKYDYTERRIEITQNNETQIISFDQVNSITTVETIDYGGFMVKGMVPWSFYSYMILNLNDGQQIKLTCLLHNVSGRNWKVITENVESTISFIPF